MNLSPFPFSWLGIDSILQWIATKLKKLRGKGLSNWPPELPFRIIENFNGNNSNDMIPSPRCLRDQIKISSRLSPSPFLVSNLSFELISFVLRAESVRNDDHTCYMRMARPFSWNFGYGSVRIDEHFEQH